MKTVISHFYNEEYLLPWWLEHHKTMFDHGIMINYGSTDNSVDIIKELCPEWEIRNSRNQFFGAIQCDQEVMDIERGISGWKMALNTTEFLLSKNLDLIIQGSGNIGVICNGFQMADPLDLSWKEPDKNQPLVKQRYWGFREREVCISGVIARERLFHPFPSGEYYPGRHLSRVPFNQSPDMLCLWYGCSPLTNALLDRRLQIQTKMPPDQGGFGWGHRVSKQDLLKGQIGYNRYIEHTKNLLEHDHKFKEIFVERFGNIE